VVAKNRKGSHLKHAFAIAVLQTVFFAAMANGATFLIEPGVPPVDPDTVLVNQSLTATFKVSLFDLDDRNVEHPVTGVRSEEYVLTAGDSGIIAAIDVPAGFAMTRTRDGNKVTLTRLGGSPAVSFTIEAAIRYLSPSTAILDKIITLSGTVLLQDGTTTSKTAEAKATAAIVRFDNQSRGRDRVVTGKFGAVSGVKEIDVAVQPDGVIARITIKGKRRELLAGSAAFLDAAGKDTKFVDVSGSKTLTLHGRDFSRAPRDVFLEATIGDAVGDRWEFTVIRVLLEAIVQGNVTAAMPATVRNFAGSSLRGMLLEDLEDVDNPNQHVLGAQLVTQRDRQRRGVGAVVIRGKIVPSGMDAIDFNNDRPQQRSTHFNLDRTIDAREYSGNGCFDDNIPGVIRAVAGTDDFQDESEDVLPNGDGVQGELFIWAFDVPNVTVSGSGNIRRTRNQFVQMARYAGVQASSPLNWYYRASVEQPPRQGANVPPIRQNDDHKANGDNEVKVGNTPLTADLIAPPNRPFVANIQLAPAALVLPTLRAAIQIPGSVTAANIKQGEPCATRITYSFDQTFTGARGLGQTRVAMFPFLIQNIGNQTVSGNWLLERRAFDFNRRVNFDAPSGAYKVQVFIGDRVFPTADIAPKTIQVRIVP